MHCAIEITSADRAITKVREDLEIAASMMVYAMKKNIKAFRFSGLRIPSIIQNWEAGMSLPEVNTFASELSIFQEHLYERIISLTNNGKMIRRIWTINEKTREFRELELHAPDSARDILDWTTTLVNALFARDETAATEAVLRCLEIRLGLVDELMCSISIPQRATA